MRKWNHIQGGSWIFAYCDRWMSVVQKNAMQPVSSLNASPALRGENSLLAGFHYTIVSFT